MEPAVPPPEDAGIVTPLSLTLAHGWKWDAQREKFVSERGEECGLPHGLPPGSRVVPTIPSLQGRSPRSVSKEESDLMRHWQVILPPGVKPGSLLAAVRRLACVEAAQVAPRPSLP